MATPQSDGRFPVLEHIADTGQETVGDALGVDLEAAFRDCCLDFGDPLGVNRRLASTDFLHAGGK
jgi:hypothetical protein